MNTKSKSFLRGVLVLFGTIVGAGVFALPVAFKETGILTGSVVFWLLALVVLATHLLYADIALRRGEIAKRKFPGQVAVILGPWAGRFALVVHPLYLLGACYAYLLLGGEFLASLSWYFGGTDFVLGWQIVFWAAGAVTVFFGLKLVARVESWLAWALIASFLLAIALFLPRADASLFATASWGRFFVPFGIFLFSLGAYSVVPDVAEICGRDRTRTIKAVATGSLGAAFIMWLFGVFGYAAVGSALSTDPSSVAQAFPFSFFWLLPLAGFLAVATSFITLMQDLRGVFDVELRLSPLAAWSLALGAPLILLFVTSRNFLASVSFVGSIFGAMIGVLIAFMALKVGESRTSKVESRIIPIACAAVFILAFVWRILFV